MNANFFYSNEENLTTSPLELFTEAKRIPEAIIALKISEKDFFTRKFDTSAIQEEYNQKLEARRIQKVLEKEEARKAAEEAGEEAGEEEEQEEEEVEDPEAPNYEEMVTTKKEELKAKLEEEQGKVSEWIEGFKEKQIPVIEIDTNTTIERVFKRVCSELKPFLEKRENLFLRHQVKILDEAYIKQNEESLIYRPSKIGLRPFLKPNSILLQRKIGLLLNNRIYYCRNEEDKQILMNEPTRLLNSKASPLDVNYNPVISIVGKPKSGKTTIIRRFGIFFNCRLCADLGLIRIKPSHVLREFVDKGFSNVCEALRQKLKRVFL